MDITRWSGSAQSQAAFGLKPDRTAANNAGMFAACEDAALRSFLDILTQPGADAQTVRARFDGLSDTQLQSLASFTNGQNRPERADLLCSLVEKLGDGHDRHRLEKMRSYFLQAQNSGTEPHSVYAEYSRIEHNQEAGLNLRQEEIGGIASEIFNSPPRRAAALFNSLDHTTWMPELARELVGKHLQPLVVLLKRLGDNPDVKPQQFANLAEAMLAQMTPQQRTAFAVELDRAGCLAGLDGGIYDPRTGMAPPRSDPMAAFAKVVLASVPNVPQPA
jgi:hypothetical protein